MMPLIYKITSVWGNHEGSMLLWVLILSLFGALVAQFGVNLPATLKAHVLAVQSWIACAFYLFILLTSNPFLRLAQAPLEGRDLNPILQDLGLAIHPPLLYLGYVGFSIAFSFAIAALIEGRIDAAWARWVRPWTLVAWMFLTLGIAMGSYWAYYTLGWGGFWFWDPVENASLMPWLAGTALLHSAVVMEKRNALKVWTILLAILDLLAVADRHLPGALRRAHLGAFLRQRPDARRVHSRHSGAVHRRRPVAVRLARAAAQAGRAVRADLARRRAGVQQSLPHHRLPDGVRRHALSAWRSKRFTGGKISVGAPFFNLTFGPLFVALMFAMPFGPLLAWKRGDLLGVAQRLMTAFGVGLVAVAADFRDQRRRVRCWRRSASAWRSIVMTGAVVDLVERTGLFRAAAGDRAHACRRAAALDLGHGGGAFRHRGVDARHHRRRHLGHRAHRRAQARRRSFRCPATI